MSKIRIAIVTDIHNGPNIANKQGTDALRLTEAFIKAANNYAPDFTLEMGDRISAVSPQEDRKNMSDIADAFQKLNGDIISINGNNDLCFLDNADNEKILGRPLKTFAMDKDGARFIFLNWKMDNYPSANMQIKQEELDWLECELGQSDAPTIIISHIPLYWPDRSLTNHGAIYNNIDDAREIVENNGNVVLCMCGHKHTNKHVTINGIPYITLQSLSQLHKDPARQQENGTYSFMEIDTDTGTIDFIIEGRYKARQHVCDDRLKIQP